MTLIVDDEEMKECSTNNETFLLDAFNEGDAVSVGINLRGSEYNGKYYLNAQGWKINKGAFFF